MKPVLLLYLVAGPIFCISIWELTVLGGHHPSRILTLKKRGLDLGTIIMILSKEELQAKDSDCQLDA